MNNYIKYIKNMHVRVFVQHAHCKMYFYFCEQLKKNTHLFRNLSHDM